MSFFYQRINRVICWLALLLFFAGNNDLIAQDTEHTLLNSIERAPDDSSRILAMGALAAFYFENYEESRGDSVLARQLLTAETGSNQRLVLWVLFNNPINKLYDVKNNKHRKQNKAWFEHAFDYAKNKSLNDYMALAYCHLSANELEDGNMARGLALSNLAVSTSMTSSNDSVKVLCALHLGNTYLIRGNAVMAFKAFNNAYDLATRKENRVLVAEVYRAIASMYKSLNQYSSAIDYLYRSLEIFRNERLREEVAADYISLGKLCSYNTAKDYLVKAEKLADTINNKGLKLEAQKILFSYIMTKEKPAVSILFLQQHPELVKLYEHNGSHYLDWMYGELYLYGHMHDSARHYFEKAAPYFEKGYSINQQKEFYGEMAETYYQTSPLDIEKAIFFKEHFLQLSKQVSDLREIKTACIHLSNLYERKGDPRRALYYNRQYDLYKDSLELLSKGKDLALLEIGAETKRKNETALNQQRERDRQHNLQYMVITICVLTGFTLLLFLGFFKLSKLTIKVMGFLSFISFFEFIIMVLDHYIHDITHGEPLKIWLIKIGLLSFLLPLHHFLEEKVIQYLLERDLIHSKNFVNLRKLLTRAKKKPAMAKPVAEEIPLQSDLPKGEM